jgi:hypothetical protein
VVWLYDKEAGPFGRPYGLTDYGKNLVDVTEYYLKHRRDQ